MKGFLYCFLFHWVVGTSQFQGVGALVPMQNEPFTSLAFRRMISSPMLLLSLSSSSPLSLLYKALPKRRTIATILRSRQDHQDYEKNHKEAENVSPTSDTRWFHTLPPLQGFSIIAENTLSLTSEATTSGREESMTHMEPRMDLTLSGTMQTGDVLDQNDASWDSPYASDIKDKSTPRANDRQEDQLDDDDDDDTLRLGMFPKTRSDDYVPSYQRNLVRSTKGSSVPGFSIWEEALCIGDD